MIDLLLAACAATALALQPAPQASPPQASPPQASPPRAAPPSRPSPPRSHELKALLDEHYEFLLRSDPVRATTLGHAKYSTLLRDESPEAYARRRAETRARLERLNTLLSHEEGGARWGEEDLLDAGLLRFELETSIAGDRFLPEQRSMDNKRGVQIDTPQMADSLPFASESDYDHFATRLESVPTLVDQTIAQMRAGIASGRVQPRVVMLGCIEQCAAAAAGAAPGPNAAPTADPNPFFKPFLKLPADSPIALRARHTVTTGIIPAYQRLAAFLKDEYLPACRDAIAASDSIDGPDLYQHELLLQTTTTLKPEEIHAIGLREVDRIRSEMMDAIARTDFPRKDSLVGDELFHAFVADLRSNPRFYFTTPDDLLRGYRDIAKRIDAQLPRLFRTLPRNPYGVREMPLISAKMGPTAYYFPGSIAGGVPGYFVANTYQLDQRPKYEMISLTMHEAVPGHHLQIALAQELDSAHPFRRLLAYNAFLEGWALYAERLGLEMSDPDSPPASPARGLYADPYDDFGRLTYEMWRACRLVVDPGMHALGWSRQQAIDFMKANTALSELNIEREIDRYIAWPGQACGYKLGELKIRELRHKAETALGDAFDLRAFHDTILGAGSLPLPVLEERVTRWIEHSRPAQPPLRQ
ncbi:MAG: DUF885 domain-containing protein [Phycisphaeraceae bacterium]|nr:DUF885 domain-containing protein [Phycisphaeraceae bacterium]